MFYTVAVVIQKYEQTLSYEDNDHLSTGSSKKKKMFIIFK